MKKILFLVPLLIIAVSFSSSARRSSSVVKRNSGVASSSSQASTDRANRIYDSVKQQYTSGTITADSVVSLAMYHKGWSPELAARCLSMVADNNLKARTELGVLYAFSPEFSDKSTEGIRLLDSAAKAGYNDANAYLGLYAFNHKKYREAKEYFEACRPLNYGFGYTALGSMYTEGKGVGEDLAKARENYHKAALKGYPRGMALYGFNMRASAAGPISYPDSFFWLYIAGDLGDDAARTTLFLPQRNENRGSGETAAKAQEALQWIEKVNSGKKIQNEPIYKEGFIASLKEREKQAEQGDDWARYYLGSMNYNGDFLNQNYAQAVHYYEPIARNGKLPANILAVVHQRLADIYRNGRGIRADRAKADQHTREAARYGNLSSYKIAEGLTD